MIRITKQRRSSYKSTGFNAFPAQWSNADHNVNGKHPLKDTVNKNIRASIQSLYEEAQDIQRSKRTISIKKLKDVLNAQKSDHYGFLSFTQKLIDDFRQEHRFGNAEVYTYCRNKVGKFLNPKAAADPKNKKRFIFDIDVEFPDMDYEWLRKLELYLKKQGLTNNSLSQVFRTIRAVYNVAMKHPYKLAKLADYPFTDFELGSRFDVDHDPDFVPVEVIWKIEDLDLSNESKHMVNARNYFLFSFYSGGQNLIDVLKIKWSDINGSVIKLSRSKTSHKARIDINEPLQRILDHYHIHGGANKEGYVFPVLSLENTPQQNRDKFKNHCSRVINPAISKLAKLAGLERGLSSKVARYSFATALHQQNIDTKTISKAMARKNDRGLEGYLGKMDERVKDAITKNLINRPNK